MALTLYLHPLSSYCHKVLIALYENGIPFTPQLVELHKAESREPFLKLWPVGKFPVLTDGDRVLPESTPIIDYLALRYPGPVALIPREPEAMLAVRALDRFYDLHVHNQMQKVIGDRIRPADKKDPHGVAQATKAIHTALAIVEPEMAGRAWAMGENFTLADCAAAPALFYVNEGIEPLAGRYPALAAYLARLKERPSYARALAEAAPYLHMFPR
ncbi:MAG: glutathione S-transferase family protein [Pseudolabrys sp.]|nr:glutathione S-transferase family protein [Pseudolabrys sp.]